MFRCQRQQVAAHNHLVTPFVSARDLRPVAGDLIEFNRHRYSHWGLYVGNGQVIHVRAGYSGGEISLRGKGAYVMLDKLEHVAGRSPVRINNQLQQAASRGLNPLPVEQLIKDVGELVGTQVHYDLMKRNCEHYVTEWRYGAGWSEQVDGAVQALQARHRPKVWIPQM